MAGATLNLDRDRVTFMNRKAVTITNADGSTATTANAIKRVVSEERFIQGEIEMVRIKARWHVWKVDLGAFVPTEHGSVTDPNGNNWYIDSVEWASLESRYAM